MRAALMFATGFVLTASSVLAQNAPDPATMPLDQLARAIANTIDSNTARSPGAPLAFDGTSIQGLQIIIHFIATNSTHKYIS